MLHATNVPNTVKNPVTTTFAVVLIAFFMFVGLFINYLRHHKAN